MRNFAFALVVGLLAFGASAVAQSNPPPGTNSLPCATGTQICVQLQESSKAFGQAVAFNARNGIRPPVSP